MRTQATVRQLLTLVVALLPVGLATALVVAAPAHLSRLAGASVPGAELLRTLGYAAPLALALVAGHWKQGRILIASLVVTFSALGIHLVRGLAGAQVELADAALLLSFTASVALVLLIPMRGRGVIRRLGPLPLASLIVLHALTLGLLLLRPDLLAGGIAVLWPMSLPIPGTALPWIATVPLTAALVLQVRLPRGDDGWKLFPVILLGFAAVLAGLSAASGAWPAIPPLAPTVFFLGGTVTLLLGLQLVLRPGEYIDEVTGLPGGRALAECLDRICGTYTVALIDVDRFGRLVAPHDGAVGEDVLRLVARQVVAAHVGTAYRQGGDEFVIVSAGKELPDVLQRLEVLRASVASRPFVLRSRHAVTDIASHEFPVAVSVGVAEHSARNASARGVLAAADSALVRAKKSGGDRVEAERRGLPDDQRRRSRSAQERAAGWYSRFRTGS